MQVAEREANAAFGDGALYLEKLVVRPRHVEVQVLADQHGTVLHLFDRDCSMQRHRQKILEEAPSAATREAMTAAAVRLARAVGYTSAGTCEFLLDDEEHFYFIEMNTRIQVEHPVTEMVTGVDLVREQILIAAGEPLALRQEDIRLNGHAIEFRINAEDPANDFFPSHGMVTALEVLGGPGVRVDSALAMGEKVPPYYDSLVSKLVVWHSTRDESILLARRALPEYRVEGIKTTVPLHLRLLNESAFLDGEYHTAYLEELLGPPATEAIP